MKIQALEITSFRLLSGTFAGFVEANKAEIDGWLKKQPGFQSRVIIESGEDEVMDLVFWNSVEEGTKAMQRIMDETATSRVHSLIDQGSVSWQIFPVGHQLAKMQL